MVREKEGDPHEEEAGAAAAAYGRSRIAPLTMRAVRGPDDVKK